MSVGQVGELHLTDQLLLDGGRQRLDLAVDQNLDAPGTGIPGGIFIEHADPTLTHCTVSGNTLIPGVPGFAGGIYINGTIHVPPPTILNNSIVAGNDPSDVVGGPVVYNHTMIGGDPGFSDAAAGDFHLAPDSPALDAGDSAAVPEDVLADLDGRPRFIDMPFVADTGSGTSPTADLGAYELAFPTNRHITFKPGHGGQQVALRVTLAATGLENGVKVLVGESWWVQPHDPADPEDIFRVGCTPHFQDWSSAPPVIQVGDTQIFPDSEYRVEAVVSGGEESETPPVRVSTTLLWGDIVGSKVDDVWTPPDARVDSSDMDAVLECFQGTPGAPPLVACDIDGSVLNAMINAGDIQQVALAEPNRLYPFAAPEPAAPAAPPPGTACPSPLAEAPATEPIVVGKNRYLSFQPKNAGGPVALRVTLAATDLPSPFRELVGQHWWVREPAVGDPVGLHRLGSLPVFRVWSPGPLPVPLPGPRPIPRAILSPVIHVGDLQIFPDSEYRVQAIREGCSVADETLFSSSLIVAAGRRWGDAAGPKVDGVWTPPDGKVDDNDIDACLDLFHILPGAPPLVWCDIDPAVPNAIVNASDIQQIVLVTGRDYPFAPPEVCAP